MKRLMTLSLSMVLYFSACAQEKEFTKEDLTTDMQKVSYSIGQDIGKNFQAQGIEITKDEFIKGLMDGMNGESLFTQEEIREILGTFQQELMAKQQKKSAADGEVNKKAGEDFLAANKSKEGVVTTESGLQYKVIKEGSGAKPAATDRVTVHYKGSLINGEEFDSSIKRGEPATFPLNGVIRGWTEGLQLMSIGSKYEFYIPFDLAYGPNGKPPVIGPFQTLIFEVELISIDK